MGCSASKPPLPLKAGRLGVIRLDYDYPPAPGDIDSQLSFDYKVVYRVVPGLTFDICQSGTLTDDVKEQLNQAISDLVVEENVHGKPARQSCHLTSACSAALCLTHDLLRAFEQASRATAAS